MEKNTEFTCWCCKTKWMIDRSQRSPFCDNCILLPSEEQDRIMMGQQKPRIVRKPAKPTNARHVGTIDTMRDPANLLYPKPQAKPSKDTLVKETQKIMTEPTRHVGTIGTIDEKMKQTQRRYVCRMRETFAKMDVKHVYVITNPYYEIRSFFKVGIATNLKQRLGSYQINSPDRDFFVRFNIETRFWSQTERYIHRKFHYSHEWVNADIFDIIKEIEDRVIHYEDLYSKNEYTIEGCRIKFNEMSA